MGTWEIVATVFVVTMMVIITIGTINLFWTILGLMDSVLYTSPIRFIKYVREKLNV